MSEGVKPIGDCWVSEDMQLPKRHKFDEYLTPEPEVEQERRTPPTTDCSSGKKDTKARPNSAGSDSPKEAIWWWFHVVDEAGDPGTSQGRLSSILHTKNDRKRKNRRRSNL